MQDTKHLITPDHHQLWTVVGFILAILALVLSMVGLYRISMATVISQAQIIMLNQKIETLSAKGPQALPKLTAPLEKP